MKKTQNTSVLRRERALWHKLSFEEGSAEQEPLPHLPSICFPPHWLDILTWKGNQSEQNTQAHWQRHTHVPAFTPRCVAWLSLAKIKCLFGAEDQKKQKKNQNNNRNYIWCLIVGKTHQHAGVGTTAWQIRRRFGEKSSKHRTARRKWGQKRKSHNSVLGSRTTIRFLREATSCSASLWAEELSTGFATCLTTKGIASITLFHTN